MTRPLLICSAYPFGYGPVVKLMLLAEKLRHEGFRTLFVGSGIGLPMASSCGLFDEVVEAQPGSPEARRLIRSGDAFLSLMERDLTQEALEASKPVYVVDSLRWMRDVIPQPFLHAREYWCQRFLTPSADPAPGTPVGPLVRAMAASLETSRSGLIVNLGGCETAAGPSEEDLLYGEFIVRGLMAMEARLSTRKHGGALRLMAGKRCVDHLAAVFPDCGIAMESVTHSEAMRLFDGAESVLTSPGLTTTLECFQLGVPTFFLPPQNYSQWRILKYLLGEKLAPEACDWSLFMTEIQKMEELPAEDRTPMVRRILKECASLSGSSRLLGESILEWLSRDRSGIAESQHDFFKSLGANGIDSIVSHLLGVFDITPKSGN
jgi:hypothetical protein